MRTLGLAIVLGAWGILALGETPRIPEARELLEAVRAREAELRTYTASGWFTFSAADLWSETIRFRIWASFPFFRFEMDMDEWGVVLPGGIELVDVSARRRFQHLGNELWLAEELEEGWEPLLSPVAAWEPEGMAWEVGEDEVAGRPAWTVTGVGVREGVEVRTTRWIDKERLTLLKVRAEAGGAVFTLAVEEFRAGEEVSPDLFRLPAGARVIARAPRSPQAEALMARVEEGFRGLTSFYAALVERQEDEEDVETEVVFWYRDPYLREERTFRSRVPGTDLWGIGPVSVSLWDMEQGVRYFQFRRRWEGMESSPVPPAERGSAAARSTFGLYADRFIALEEGELAGRPVWVVTGEMLSLPEVREGEPLARARWWIDRETHRVLQYEEPVTFVLDGVRLREVRVVRVREFRPGAEVPPEKLVVPEGVPIRKFPELPAEAPEAPVEKGERLERGLTWEPYTQARWEEARGRKVVLYFGADWCEPCHLLEAGPFRDSLVVGALEGFVRLKVDLSDWQDRAAREAERAHRVSALPSVILFDEEGKEIGRITGYSPRWVSELLALVRGGRR